MTGLRETGQPNSDICPSKKLHKNCRENYQYPIFSKLKSFLSTKLPSTFLLALSIRDILATGVKLPFSTCVVYLACGCVAGRAGGALSDKTLGPALFFSLFALCCLQIESYRPEILYEHSSGYTLPVCTLLRSRGGYPEWDIVL